MDRARDAARAEAHVDGGLLPELPLPEGVHWREGGAEVLGPADAHASSARTPLTRAQLSTLAEEEFRTLQERAQQQARQHESLPHPQDTWEQPPLPIRAPTTQGAHRPRWHLRLLVGANITLLAFVMGWVVGNSAWHTGPEHGETHAAAGARTHTPGTDDTAIASMASLDAPGNSPVVVAPQAGTESHSAPAVPQPPPAPPMQLTTGTLQEKAAQVTASPSRTPSAAASTPPPASAPAEDEAHATAPEQSGDAASANTDGKALAAANAEGLEAMELTPEGDTATSGAVPSDGAEEDEEAVELLALLDALPPPKDANAPKPAASELAQASASQAAAPARAVWVPPPPASDSVPQTLTREAIREVVSTHADDIAGCGRTPAEGAATRPARTLVAQWTIQTDGSTRDVTVDSESTVDAALMECVRGHISRWRFPAHQQQLGAMRFPFTL